MEPDSSLLDEDDSLLREISKLEESVDQLNPSCPSPKNNSSKENINMNKVDGPKLTMEPVSMKRRKKGVGYNLRKSLAWDRAFFTEEGVLDPIELSIITGTCVNSGGEGLSVISEEGSNLISGDSRYTNSPNLQSRQMKKASTRLFTRHGSTSSGVKSSGCPRASPSSSLKRPAFVNASRSSTKELKFPKNAIPKPGSCSVSRSAENSEPVGSSLNHSHSVKPAVRSQMAVGSKIFTNIKKNPKVKAASAASLATSSTKFLKGKSASSPLATQYTNIRPPLVSKVSNTCSKATPKYAVALGMPQPKENGSAAVTGSVPQNTSTGGSSMCQEKTQPRKPSGLRMPSPSLGYFGQTQPKVPGSNNSTLISFKLNAPRLGNAFDLTASPAPDRKGKTLGDFIASSNTMLLSSRADNSAVSGDNAVSRDISRPALEAKKLDSLEHADVEYDELAVGESLDAGKRYKDDVKDGISGRIFVKEVGERQMDVTAYSSQSEAGELFLEADDLKKGIQEFQESKNSKYSDPACSPSMDQKLPALGVATFCNSAVSNPGPIFELQSEVIAIGLNKKSLMVQSHPKMPTLSYEPSSLIAEAKLSALGVLDDDKDFLNIKDNNISTPFEEAAVSLNMGSGAPESFYSELGSSCSSSPERNTDCSIDAVSGSEMVMKTYLEEEQFNVCKETLGSDCPTNYLNVKSVDGDSSVRSEEHLGAGRICLVIEENSDNIAVLGASKNSLQEEKSKQEKIVENLPLIIPEVLGRMQADDLDTHGHLPRKDSLSEHLQTTFLVDNNGFSPRNTCIVGANLNSRSPALVSNLCLREQTELVEADTSKLLNNKDMSNMNNDELNGCLSDSLHNERHEMEVAQNSLLLRKRASCDFQDLNLRNVSLTATHLDGDCENSISLSDPINSVHAKIEREGDGITPSISGNVPVDWYAKHASLVHDYENQQELTNTLLVVAIESKWDDRLLVTDHIQDGICSISEQSLLNNISESCSNAVPQNSDAYKGEPESRSADLRGLCLVEKVCNNTEKLQMRVEDGSSDFSCINDAQLKSEFFVPIPETLEQLADSHFKHNVQLKDEATSSCSSGAMATDVNDVCVNTSSTGNCSPDCLITGENLRRNQHDFDGLMKNILVDEENVEIHDTVDALASEVLNETPRSTTDKIMIGPIKNCENDLNRRNAPEILPRDLVPFSEEWLAAVEAAGEDVLTLKTGAVQNSPPDKSQPEPSPWSPVRRKNNQLGPFDCTKFTNPIPSDSQ